MNILKFIESLSDSTLLNSTGSRRESLSKLKAFGANAALASLPLGIASLAMTPQKANAAGSLSAETPTQALQLALTLEYLEAEFYNMALSMGNNLIPSADRPTFEQIAQHENDHVDFLKAGLGNSVVAKPTFDFTGGQGQGNGPFDPFNDYPTFLALAQAFEDTGVRAYKGQAGNLITTPDLLEAALQIHSVEARHAAQVRRLRTKNGLVAGQKGWITGNNRGGLPQAAQPVYDGEETTTQAGFNTAGVSLTIGGTSGASAGSESFDEPISGQTATTIASLFIVP